MIENVIIGVEGMMYMLLILISVGLIIIEVIFEIGIDVD